MSAPYVLVTYALLSISSRFYFYSYLPLVCFELGFYRQLVCFSGAEISMHLLEMPAVGCQTHRELPSRRWKNVYVYIYIYGQASGVPSPPPPPMVWSGRVAGRGGACADRDGAVAARCGLGAGAARGHTQALRKP